jgi:hypothetical protein
MLRGVHSALQPAGATVVGVLSGVGLAAVIGAIVAICVPGLKQTAAVASGGDQQGQRGRWWLWTAWDLCVPDSGDHGLICNNCATGTQQCRRTMH